MHRISELAVVPDVGFASTSNDGTTRIRCGADAALPEDAGDTVVFDAARWPREGWGSAKVLAELVHPRKPGVNHYVPRIL